MAAASNYLEQALLNEIFRNTNYAPPAGTYVALHTADPTDANLGGTEVAGNGYARLRVYTDGATAPYWAAPATEAGGGYEVNNIQELTFPEATGGTWGTVTHISIYDAAAAGNLLFSQALTGGGKTIGDGEVFRVKVNELRVRLR